MILLGSLLFPANADHLLLTRVVTQPDAAESFSIYNPTDSAINLSDYYICDDEDYYKMQTEGDMSPSSTIWGFTVQFPDITIFPGDTLHIVFNVMWWWELGGLVERFQSPKRLWLVFFVISIGSNTSQFFAEGNNFGGLSGVVYGLLGYLWFYGRMRPDYPVQLNPSLILALNIGSRAETRNNLSTSLVVATL